VEEEWLEGLEVRAKGPVHEAFATPATDAKPTPIVMQQPPDPIEELPPEEKPAGDNVVWIPGYWHWDEDDQQFIWVSGFWRAVPAGRVWVPGWWRAVSGGWQWVPGFWQTTQIQEGPQGPVAAVADVEYLPEPPPSIEIGPSVPAPFANAFYVPGHWVWRGRYVWRPGFWWEFRPGWIWIPAHYRWTPLGWVYVAGYWDYPLAVRGVLFAPVVIRPILWRRPAFVYTPIYVVSEPALYGALFVRRGWSCYFFGDYFGPRYTELGFSAWCGRVGPGGGFAIGFSTGRAWGYDPLWSYYSLAYRHQPAWSLHLNTLYLGRFRGELPRPPVNLVQQNTIINNITQTNIRNVSNNITVVNRTVVVNKKDVTPLAMVAPLKVATQLQPEVSLRTTSPEIRKQEALQARQLRELAGQRAKLEVVSKAKTPAVKDGANIRSLQLQVPPELARRVASSAAQQPLPPGVSRPHVSTPPTPVHDSLSKGKKVVPETSPPQLPVTPKGTGTSPPQLPVAPKGTSTNPLMIPGSKEKKNHPEVTPLPKERGYYLPDTPAPPSLPKEKSYNPKGPPWANPNGKNEVPAGGIPPPKDKALKDRIMLKGDNKNNDTKAGNISRVNPIAPLPIYPKELPIGPNNKNQPKDRLPNNKSDPPSIQLPIPRSKSSDSKLESRIASPIIGSRNISDSKSVMAPQEMMHSQLPRKLLPQVAPSGLPIDPRIEQTNAKGRKRDARSLPPGRNRRQP
jgi:hypothetical protein